MAPRRCVVNKVYAFANGLFVYHFTGLMKATFPAQVSDLLRDKRMRRRCIDLRTS